MGREEIKREKEVNSEVGVPDKCNLPFTMESIWRLCCDHGMALKS